MSWRLILEMRRGRSPRPTVVEWFGFCDHGRARTPGEPGKVDLNKVDRKNQRAGDMGVVGSVK